LFERLGKRVKLTEEREILFKVISNFFNALEKLNIICEDMQSGKSGSLSMATSSSIMNYVSPDIIKKFKGRFPKTKLRFISCKSTPEILSMVLEGEVDLGIGLNTNQPTSNKICFLI
jgi:DNA-binding transcriptional LysR family regulator